MKLEIARYNEGKQIPSAICKLYPQLEYATLHLIGDKMDLRSGKAEHGDHYDRSIKFHHYYWKNKLRSNYFSSNELFLY